MAVAAAERSLQVAGKLLFVATQNDARLALAHLSGTRYVAWSAAGETCPFCAAMDGKVFEAASLRALRWRPPAHINCRCIWVAVLDTQTGRLDLFDANDARLRQLAEDHAHFIHDGTKYTELRLPASPSGPDVTFRRGKAGELGELEWHVPRYRIPGLDSAVRQTGVEAAGRAPTILDRTLRGDLVGPAAGRLPGVSLDRLQAEVGLSLLRNIAQREFPHITWGLAGLASEAVLPALEQFLVLAKDWPEVARNIRSVVAAPLAPDAVGSSQLGEIRLNVSVWSDASGTKRDFADQERLGALPPGTASFEGYLTHEFGHQVVYSATTGDWPPAQTVELLAWLDAHPDALDLNRLARGEDEVFAYAFQTVYHGTGELPPTAQSLRELLRKWGKVGPGVAGRPGGG